MTKQEAEAAFFEALNGWFSKPVEYLDEGKGVVSVWFNNEYPVEMALDVVKALWPDAIEGDV